MARRYLRLTPEDTWGGGPGAGTPLIIDLDQANSYDVRPKPVRWTTRTAGTSARRHMTGSQKTMLAGNLNILLHGSQGAAIAAWVTATAAGVLPSMCIDYVFVMEDAGSTHVYSRDVGMMVQQCALTASEQNQLVRLGLQLIGKSRSVITIAEFPEPAAADYASDALYVFEMLSGHLTIGTSRTEFESLNVTIKNTLDTRFFESASPTRIKYCGRDVDWTSKLAHKVQTDRAALEAVTPIVGTADFVNGSHHLTLNFESKNYFSEVADDQDDQKVFLQAVTLESYFDATAATPNDFTMVGT